MTVVSLQMARTGSGRELRGLVLNLADVSFIDSTGIGVLVGVWRRTKATDGSLALATPSRQAQSVLDATGLTLWGSRTRPPVLTWASTRPARIR